MENSEFEDLIDTLIEFAGYQNAMPDEAGMCPDYVEFEDSVALVWTEYYRGQHYTQGAISASFDLSELTNEQIAILHQKLPSELVSEVENARRI